MMIEKVTVVGAGMAGLLAGNMLQDRLRVIDESQPSLPNNHSAVLRFRSTVVSDTLNIPFREVATVRAVESWRNPVADMLSYSLKTTGIATMRSSAWADGEVCRRYIAPPDLIERMARPLAEKIQYGIKFAGAPVHQAAISTIPMHQLMLLLDYPRRSKIEFRHRAGFNIVAELDDVDAYCSLYVPDPSMSFSRVTLTGGQMVMEFYGRDDVKLSDDLLHEGGAAGGLTSNDVLYKFARQGKHLLGLDDCYTRSVNLRWQKYAKILPIDEDERRRFILWASEHHRIYSLGRYAVWRPGLLLDDLVQDFRIIMRLIDRGNHYDFAKE